MFLKVEISSQSLNPYKMIWKVKHLTILNKVIRFDQIISSSTILVVIEGVLIILFPQYQMQMQHNLDKLNDSKDGQWTGKFFILLPWDFNIWALGFSFDKLAC